MFASTLRGLLPWASNHSSACSFTTSPLRLDDGSRLSGKTHRVNNFEKRLLVWMGKYKNIEDIPAYVAPEAVEKARSKMRIRVANIMMVMTLVGCIAMVYSGKRARDRGDSVHKMNLEMHRKYNEEHAAKESTQKSQ